MKTIKLLAILFISSLATLSCSSDDDGNGGDGNDEELITTVTYTLTNTADNTDVVTLKFTDLDGEGGADGTYDVSGPFTASATYSGVMKLENATENPTENVTEEVEAEGDEHEFFYSNTADLMITKTDVDANGDPLGIETTVVAGTAGTGALTVILKHEPTKPNDGTTAGAGGSSEVNVSYSITVQ